MQVSVVMCMTQCDPGAGMPEDQVQVHTHYSMSGQAAKDGTRKFNGAHE
jgi:hypothetical protein